MSVVDLVRSLALILFSFIQNLFHVSSIFSHSDFDMTGQPIESKLRPSERI